MVRRVSAVEPQGRFTAAAHEFFRDLFRTCLRLVWRLQVSEVPVLPDGAVIVAANHRSFLDPLVLAAPIDRRVTFMMSSKYYDMPLLNWFFRMARCIVVEHGRESAAPLREAVRVLQAGHVLGIFPEGHISPDGRLQPGQPGLAWIARRTGAPVYPMHIGGTREALRKGQAMLRMSHITVKMGAPLSIGDYPEGAEGNARFTADVMAAIEALGR